MNSGADENVYIVSVPDTPSTLPLVVNSAMHVSSPYNKEDIMQETTNTLPSIVAKQMDSEQYNSPFYTGFVDPHTHTPSGWGMCYFPGNDVILSGNFEGNLENATDCVLNWKSKGIMSHGNVQNNKLDGMCTVHVNAFPFYEGDMTAGKFNGAGRLVSSAYEYEGEFYNGKRNGMGQLRYENKKYSGRFSNDQAHGAGKIAIDTHNGVIEVLSGSFVHGEPHGECTLADSHSNKWVMTFDHGIVIEKITAQEKETRDLKAEVDRLNKVVAAVEARECIICRETDANTAIPQCGHVCMCAKCEHRLTPKVCPFCRIRYSEVVKLRYMS